MPTATEHPPKRRNMIPFFLLLAIAAPAMGLPGGATAQIPSGPGGFAIGLAISEARQSPFHVSPGSAVQAARAMHGSRSRLPVPPKGAFYHPDNDGLPSFGAVFPTTLLWTYVADVAGFGMMVGIGYSRGMTDWRHELLAVAVPVLGPPLVASMVGVPFLPSLAGSVIGIGTIVGVVACSEPDWDADGWVWLFPLVHATMTTSVGIWGSDLLSALRSWLEG